MDKFVWNGIYKNFKEALPFMQGDGFSGKRWLSSLKDRMPMECIENNALEYECFLKHRSLYLPMLISTWEKEDQGCTVLDFGGGLGENYFALRSSTNIKINYYIIEQEEIVAVGKKLYKNSSNLNFVNSLHEIPNEIDYIFFGSSIQYIDQWEIVLQKCLEKNPRSIIFDDLPAGKNLSFVTLQTYYESQIIYRFFNLTNLKEWFEDRSYKVVYCAPFENLGEVRNYPKMMANFPMEYRLDYCRSLVIRKNMLSE